MSDRNLNPHAEAVAAMYLFGDDYSRSNLGCMDYYDRLSDHEKRLCISLVNAVLSARTRRAQALTENPS